MGSAIVPRWAHQADLRYLAAGWRDTTDEVRIGKLCKTVQEFYTFIDRNRAFIPNYGERYRSGERIGTGFVESTVNQVVSKRMVEKAADALEPPGCPPVAPDSHACAQRRLGGRLSQMVSGIPGPDTARFRLSLSDSFSFVQSVGIRRTLSQGFMSARFPDNS